MQHAANDLAQADAIEVLTFDLRGETFALEAGLVREVLDLLPETAIPGAPGFVGAVVNFRGRVIPLVDLGLAFDMPPTATTTDSRIIVIECPVGGGQMLMGLRADKVFEVTTIDHATTEQAPRVGLRWRPDFIRRLAKREGDLIVIPDLPAIFATMVRIEMSAPSLTAI